MSEERPFAEVGQRIQRLRGELTQEEFAGRLGVDRKSVSGWETGKRLPDGSSLLVMRRDMGADLNFILGGGEADLSVLSPEERSMVEVYRAAPPVVRRAAQGALLSALSTAAYPSNQSKPP
jgi:transcriptional regulator with XRE-family HTH domain